MPAVVGYLILAGPLVAVLLERGAFDADATAATTDVLRYMALGLPGFSVYLFALRGFYAKGDTRTPFLLNVGSRTPRRSVSSSLLVPNVDNPGRGWASPTPWRTPLAAVAALVVLHRRVGGVLEGRLGSLVVRLAAAGVGAAVAAAGAVAVRLRRRRARVGRSWPSASPSPL